MEYFTDLLEVLHGADLHTTHTTSTYEKLCRTNTGNLFLSPFLDYAENEFMI